MFGSKRVSELVFPSKPVSNQNVSLKKKLIIKTIFFEILFILD